MSLDTYQPCPCGNGKKIKFCPCANDMVADLEKVLRAVEGGQRVAGLELIDRLIAERGERPALLALKADVLLAQGMHEQAEDTIVAFQKVSPHNPVALALGAILAVTKDDTPGAVEKLQQALECTEQMIAAPVYTAIGLVATGLLNAGHILAARGHWLMQAGMAGERDSQPAERLMHMNLSRDIPLLLKDDQAYSECPEDAPWRGEFGAAMMSARKGTWLAACESLDSLAEKATDEPAILRNIAILRGWLGQTDLAVKAWRSYASLPDVPLDEAVEAEALAQMLDVESLQEVDQVMAVHTVTDAEQLMETLLSDKRVAKTPLDPAQLGSEGQPPPKGVFWLLDRPASDAENVPREEIPCIIAEMLVYGKQTDRAARLEVAMTRSPDYEQKKATLAEVVGELVEPNPSVETTGKVSAVTEALSWRWHLPNNVTRERRLELIDEQQSEIIFNLWPQLELNVLDGRRAADVASDEAYRVRILAAIMLLESACESNERPIDFNELRRKLELPEVEPVRAEGDEIMRISLPRLALIECEPLDDMDLVKAFQRSVLSGHRLATVKFGTEVLKRDSTREIIKRQDVYEPLIRSCQNSDQALDFVHQAQEESSRDGESSARWLLTELSMRLSRGEGDECNRLIETLRDRHMNEPGVAESLYRLLVAHGVVSPDGQAPMPGGPMPGGAVPGGAPVPQQAAPAAEGSKLWTPDAPSPASEGGSGKSKLWVPGAD